MLLSVKNTTHSTGYLTAERWGTRSGFTLSEVLSVAAILGILAAVTIPEYKGYTQKAKEYATKKNLQILLTAISKYALEHNGIPPGYALNNPDGQAGQAVFYEHMVTGNPSYLSGYPENPFNKLVLIRIIQTGEPFPDGPTGSYGRTYKPETKEV